MNIKQLRYVSAILSTGSFSGAAAYEGVSVQAVSKAMSELEREVGEPLFRRTSSGVIPTPLGEALGPRVDAVLEDFGALERFVRSWGEGSSGRLVMGLCIPSFPGIDTLMPLVRRVTELALGRAAEVRVTAEGTCVADLRSGRIDALVTVGPLREKGIVCGSLGTMMPGVVMARTHPLAHRSEVTIADLSPYPVALAPSFEHFNEAVCRAYAARGLASEQVEVESGEEYRALLFGRDLYSFVVGGDLLGPFEECVLLPIAPADRLPVPICLSSLAGSDISCHEFARALSKMKILS